MREILDLDTVSTLLIGMVGTFVIVAGSMSAARFARRTRVRLARASKKTQPPTTERPPMIVNAQNRMNEHLVLRFKSGDPAITLFGIALDNQLDNAIETIDCVNVDPQIFVATVESKVVQRWYNANRYWNGETKQLPIRVFMGDGEHAACHTIWVMMTWCADGLRPYRR